MSRSPQLSCAATIALCALAAASVARGQPEASGPQLPRRFTFDGAFAGAPGLGFEFTRGTYDDLFAGAFPGKLYTPRAGTICHGLIVLLCEVMTDVSPPHGDWRSSAIAFATSQDQGRTWNLQFEDAPVDFGVRRGE